MQAVLVGSCAAFRTEFLKTSSGEHACIAILGVSLGEYKNSKRIQSRSILYIYVYVCVFVDVYVQCTCMCIRTYVRAYVRMYAGTMFVCAN